MHTVTHTPLIHTLSLTLTLTHSHTTLIHTHTHTLRHSHTYTHSLTHIHTHTYSHTHTTHTHKDTNSHMHTITQIYSHIHNTLTHTHSHNTHIHTHTHTHRDTLIRNNIRKCSQMEGHGFQNDKDDQVWWRIYSILAFKRQQQSDLCEFKASLVSILSQDSPGSVVPVPKQNRLKK